MKLIDLLVKELPNRGGWPEGADYCVQENDNSCDVKFGAGEATLEYDVRGVWVNNKTPDWGINTPESYISDLKIIASDAGTAMLNREQYESALAASDGWIEWGGGECPVDEGTIVDLKDRDGYLWLGAEALLSTEAKAEFWRHSGFRAQSSEIIAYRLHKSDINSRANDDRLEQDLNECIGQPIKGSAIGFNDIDWRADWNGIGFPPVGAICQARVGGEWTDVKVVYIGDEGGWNEALVFDVKSTKPAWADEFRPLRTEVEKARELAVEDITNSMGVFGVKSASELLYADIAAGKIRGVKLEDK